MTAPMPASSRPRATPLPAIPALAVNAVQAALLMPDGEVRIMNHEQARLLLHKQPVMMCHAPYTRQRLGLEECLPFDVLELFAFTHPARFCVPTIAGLAKVLGVGTFAAFDEQPFALRTCAETLLADLAREPRAGAKSDPLAMAQVMGLNGRGWPWTPAIQDACGEAYDPQAPVVAKPALNIWKYLPEWAEDAPPPPPAHQPVSAEESHERLAQLLGPGAESRPAQRDYAALMSKAFAPPQEENVPQVVLAEAGTGTGKTLGYLAPASVWAEKNKGAVWISTYTKNLQRQVDQELDRLYTDPDVKAARVAIRKGRENYLCLLNLEDVAAGAALAKNPDQVVAAGLMARWAERTRDGDLSGGDFPGWLPGLRGARHTSALADRRGECIYAACDHYHRCFVERAVRRARRADLVIANHALVMTQTALAGPDDALPGRYVFDEGHHLFDAADAAFSAHLSALECADLRRWIRGAEGGQPGSRARGLRRRVEDLVAGDDAALRDLETVLHEATHLAGPGWTRRLKDGTPQNSGERFLAGVYRQVMARAGSTGGPYSLETETLPLVEGLAELALDLREHLVALRAPMMRLAAALRRRINEQAATLDTDTRKRMESTALRLTYNAEHMAGAWIAMLEGLEEETPAPGYVDWMEIARIDGKAIDVGLYRHAIDPMQGFAAALRPHAQALAMTSATLRDEAHDDNGEGWRGAYERTGAGYFGAEVQRGAYPSPFPYADCTRVLVITDVKREDADQVAAAYRTLFLAAGGGALGLFTAIQRLRAVHERIGPPLEQAGIALYGQHVDAIDTGTLVDIFREEPDSCLLGTDAVRDGIDVPGEALRLIVYDRVPWPRPTILHRARREAFGGRRYDEMMTRLKLRQAFGRLIRRADDRGVFVMLDSALPSRLHNAFPEGVTVERLGLAEAAQAVKTFLEK